MAKSGHFELKIHNDKLNKIKIPGFVLREGEKWGDRKTEREEEEEEKE